MAPLIQILSALISCALLFSPILLPHLILYWIKEGFRQIVKEELNKTFNSKQITSDK